MTTTPNTCGLTCDVCGRQVRQAGKGRPKSRHEECRKAIGYLRAAARELGGVEWADKAHRVEVGETLRWLARTVDSSETDPAPFLLDD